MRQGKYIHVAERLSRRIKAGDYHLQPLPAERELAVEVGVSHATARKAVQVLLDQGLLYRMENGRLAVRGSGDPDDRRVDPQIALLVPAWESNEVNRWQIAMTRQCARMKCSLRAVRYAHWDDPTLLTTLERFDGTFFMTVAEPMPEHFMRSFLAIRKPIVVLGSDWTPHGVPSMRLCSAVQVHKLLDHLASLGHRKIDFFNVQPMDSVVEGYIQQWNIWRVAHGMEGRLINEPVQPYTETLPEAYVAIARRLRAGELDCTAMVCIHERAATGVMRAMADHGLRPGHDIAVCTIDDAGRAEYAIPSLTSLQLPDPGPYVAVCLEWMLAGDQRQWHGPLMVQPDDVPLAVRQSTVPDIDSRQPPARALRGAGH